MLRRSKRVLNLECRPVHRGRPAHTQRMVQLPEVHPRTVRPIERTPRAQNPDTKSRGTRDNAVRLRHVEPTCVPLRHAAPSLPQQVLDSLHPVDETTINCADHPISYLLDTLIKTGSESIEATIRRRRILFAGFVPRMEDTRLPKCVMFGELELCGGAEKRVDGVFPGRPQSFRHQRRPVDDCSPAGRGGMAQNGRTRGGTFHCKMDRCRGSQGCGLRHTVVRPNVTGRTKERIAQSKRASTGSLALVD